MSLAREEHLEDFKTVGILRRFAAMVYDGILLFAVLFFAALIVVLPFEITHEHDLYFVFVIYIYIVAFLFLAWPWTRAGQTLGMKAWHIQLLENDGNLLSWNSALRRFISILVFWIPAAIIYYLSPHHFQKYSLLTLIPLVTDYLSCMIDRDKRALHDIMSRTRLTIRNKNTT